MRRESPTGPVPVRRGSLCTRHENRSWSPWGRGAKDRLLARAKTERDVREVVTDAAGHYSVRLPDGQWIVRMKMPSGKIYALSQLVVKSGQIHDDLDRDIPTLNISR